jgi:hypothetical protein
MQQFFDKSVADQKGHLGLLREKHHALPIDRSERNELQLSAALSTCDEFFSGNSAAFRDVSFRRLRLNGPGKIIVPQRDLFLSR